QRPEDLPVERPQNDGILHLTTGHGGNLRPTVDRPHVCPSSLRHLAQREGDVDMRKWLPLITVCLGTFMLLIDVTIPDMAKDLHTSFGALQWVVDAYALSLAALVLGAGSIADMVGHRRA